MKAKKLIGMILTFIAVLIIAVFTNTVEAASLGYVTITKDRKVENITYKHQLYSNNTTSTKNVWKLVTCNKDGTITNKLPDIYCLRAGLGFTSESLDHTVVEYNQSYDMMRQYESLVNYFSTLESETNIFDEENKEKFDAVIWVLDNMLLEGANEEQVTEYLKNYAGYTNERLSALEDKENVLTRADIEAIQQLVIWYFTNNDEEAYNKESLPTLYLSVTGSELFDTGKDELTGRDKYETFADIYDGYDENAMPVGYGRERQEKAEALYSTLIAKAKEAAKTEYKPTRDITIYLAGTDAALEQPIVRVREHQKEVDVALRKFISKINGEKLTGEDLREPIPDTSKLNKVVGDKLQTTAIYNHTKSARKVSIGDTVTYTLRIYNEGEVNTYIKEITDYLPGYLEYVAYGSDDGKSWVLDKKTGRTAISAESCKVTGVGGNISETEVGKKLGEVLLPAAEYDENKDSYTLSYVDVEISCKVTPQVPYDTNITNIAQITKLTDVSGKNLEQDRDSVPKNTNNGLDDGLTLPEDNKLPSYTGGKNGKNDPCYDGTNKTDKNYYPGQEDDDDFEKIYVKAPAIDVALRKFISKINGDALTGEDLREPILDTSKLNKVVGDKVQTTAIYNHTKDPRRVSIGDTVTYTLRMYNEGEMDTYIKEVTDYLPSYLEYVGFGNDEGTSWILDEETGRIAVSTEFCKVTGVGGNIPETEIGKTLGEVLLPAAEYDEPTDSYTLSYVDIEISCKVMPKVPYDTNITNIAQITKLTDANGRNLERDRDSVPKNTNNGLDDGLTLPEDEKLPSYTGGKNGKNDPYYDGTNKTDKNYYPGQEDDDDFEKVYVETPVIDLALRKFISKVGDTKYDRAPVVDTSGLKQGAETAIYNHSKMPIQVEVGDIVTYTLRIYNEGEVNGKVTEVTDYLAKFLSYVPSSNEEKEKWWTQTEGEKYNTVVTTENCKITNVGGKTDKAYIGANLGDAIIPAYNKEEDVLSYIDIEINCKVLPVDTKTKVTNIAEITKETDEYGTPVDKDRDSNPGNVKLPEDLPGYKDDESDKPYVPGQQDDDDFEKVIIKPKFDLALRKFITKVGEVKVNNRYPNVSYENGKLKYEHTKKPVDVKTGDIVTYTIRIFNEGEASGYANEITDDVPEGLEFLPENETNKEYRWDMLDENEEKTTDVTKAKYIITDYLSEAQEKETGRKNKLNAFDKEKEISETNPDFKDVQIAFKVTYVAKTKDEAARTIINTAQISKDSDDDIDSIPKRDEVYNHEEEDRNEDDIDYDQVKVKYFDLSLLKWVNKTIVTLNGETTELESGHTKETAKNEDPVKYEVKSKDIKKINIKYEYTIAITNEGELEGYAKEITDYIPEGLKFEKEDNPEWYEKENGMIGTKALENTLLKPGESAEVKVILTWINGNNNFGEKVNLAEISEDYNEGGSPDVDSTPNNKVPGEDDIDDAPSILTIKTGVEKIYIGLTLIICITFAGGIGLIKKYVLEY